MKRKIRKLLRKRKEGGGQPFDKEILEMAEKKKLKVGAVELKKFVKEKEK